MSRLTIALLAALLTFVAFGQEYEPRFPVLGPVQVLHIVDGATLVLDSNLGPRTVRLLGIDTPEMSAGLPGSVAKERLATLTPEGSQVWVELDIEIEDRYGRLLAYLYVPDPFGSWRIGGMRATQVNLAMVEAGWADTMTIAPNTAFADLYATARDHARSAGLGQWGDAWGAGAGVGAGARAGVGPGAAGGAATGAAAGAGLHLSGNAASSAGDPVRLKCALVNPSTPNDTGAEWVSVEISSPTDTTGYFLWDEGSNSTFRLPTGVSQPGEIRIVNPGQGVWNNSGDTIYLMKGGSVVDQWTYTRKDAVEDRVTCR